MEQETNNSEEIRKKFSSLPSDIKALAYSADMLNIIKQIAEKNQLHIDKIEILEGEAVDVMTGFTPPRDFVASLVENLEVDKVKAEAVAKDVNELLFSKIRDSMKRADMPIEPAHESSNPLAVSNSETTEKKSDEKSVVMPSAAKVTPASTPAVVVPPTPAKPAEPPAMTHIDSMLAEPTVSIAPQTPAATPAVPAVNATKPTESAKVETPKPGPIYKTDPYHEPID
jgi:hypothetical protein